MSSERMSFIDLVSHGDARLSQIDDFVDRWHEGGVSQDLPTFLGMDMDEYALWLIAPEALNLIAEAARDRNALVALVKARRKQSVEGADRLDAWLAAQSS